ncbi:MAG: Cof-type HAD-IIB family hydrolase [Dehalococcoidia bacterium]
MGYKLIAFDLDGTLYDRHAGLTLSPRTREAVGRVRELGAEVTIATGRMFSSTLRFCTELGLTIPIICYQGALIGDPVTKEVMWEKPVPLDMTRRVIGLVEDIGIAPYVFIRDDFYVRERTDRVRQYENALDITAREVGNLAKFLREGPTKLVVVGEEAEMSEVEHRVKETFGSSLSVVRTYDHLCEIGHPEASKGQALSYLASTLGVSREETVAVGDSPNDVDMIRWAGLGVAMASASPEVVEAADLMAKPVSEDGVADLLDDLISRSLIAPLL